MNTDNATALNRLFNELRETNDKKAYGTAFEQLCGYFLKEDGVQRDYYTEVLPYGKWGKRYGIRATDLGIDLVAKRRPPEKGYAAIQCKFRLSESVLSRKEVDSFIAASSKVHFTQRLLISTAGLGKHVIETLKNQSPEVRIFGSGDLAESDIDWSKYLRKEKDPRRPKKKVRPHQEEAIQAVCEGLATADRGQLIMACGSGKTFTSLEIATRLAGEGKRVLYLVPSLSLMSQTIREWHYNRRVDIFSSAVCSDVQVGRILDSRKDEIQASLLESPIPVTTDANKLVQKAFSSHKEKMLVVFSTYQSIQVISDAQKKGLPEFDLIICDEAHRTTGVESRGEQEDTNFIKVHDNDNVRGKKRLYMTATPRIYRKPTKKKAVAENLTLYSMDDEDRYGKELYALSFKDAIKKKLLTDYKVLILTLPEEEVSLAAQKQLEQGGSTLSIDEATKILGIYKAIVKGYDRDEGEEEPGAPMKRVLAFCNTIDFSKELKSGFSKVIEVYHKYLEEKGITEKHAHALCEIEHVDGTQASNERTRSLNWLAEDSPHEERTCRLLTNVRCLSEGVDIPALDGIIFVHPRKSEVEVIQAVGRVMRRAEGKDIGYVIIPVAVRADRAVHEAMTKDTTYEVVWQILNALRSHDERIGAEIEQLRIGEEGERIKIKSTHIGEGVGAQDQATDAPLGGVQKSIDYVVDEFKAAIQVKIVHQCGQPQFWKNWGERTAKIAANVKQRIQLSINDTQGNQAQAFDTFLQGLKKDVHEGISKDDALEMLVQQVVSEPIFNALFGNNLFTKQNPVSKLLHDAIESFKALNVHNETKELKAFYKSVSLHIQGLKRPKSRQEFIRTLYDNFFTTAFSGTKERLGITYTPMELVDFLLHSVNDALDEHFDASLADKGVSIIDPFAGTGSFFVRMMQNGLMPPEALDYKYGNELYANEIVLLAYYIAAINIEQERGKVRGEETYQPFPGICLTDTFELGELKHGTAFPDDHLDNSQRIQKQRAQDIRVIISNPPYSIGQKSANDNLANRDYERLDQRIRDTYAKHSQSHNLNSLYDSYIRALRWGADRLGDKGGILAYITNAGWLDSNTMDGLRKCMVDDFDDLYIVHLRGNQRTKGEESRKEGGKVFGEGSRQPIALNLFIKNPQRRKEKASIHFYDIGDYLDREQKLDKLRDLKGLKGIRQERGWQSITPNASGDWLNPRDDSFEKHYPLSAKEKQAPGLFAIASRGVVTNRDAWVYNPSLKRLKGQVGRMMDFYNQELARYQEAGSPEDVGSFIEKDETKISWSRSLIQRLEKGKGIGSIEEEGSWRRSLYRPFTKQWLYFSHALNEVRYQMPKLFPEADSSNRVIYMMGRGVRDAFSCLMTDTLPDRNVMTAGIGYSLCVYAAVGALEGGGGEAGSTWKRSSALKREGLDHFRAGLSWAELSAEDLFYYVYGVLHHKGYRKRYANNFGKEVPRIPLSATRDGAEELVRLGRVLGELHVGYETEDYNWLFSKKGIRLVIPGTQEDIQPPTDKEPQEKFYRVRKIREIKNPLPDDPKKKVLDKTRIIYNDHVEVRGIPPEAWDYEVNGKAALKWVIERQGIKIDKDSGILSDANAYAAETAGDVAYPLHLLLRVISISLRTRTAMDSCSKVDLQ